MIVFFSSVDYWVLQIKNHPPATCQISRKHNGNAP
jgi:hypothetical protein